MSTTQARLEHRTQFLVDELVRLLEFAGMSRGLCAIARSIHEPDASAATRFDMLGDAIARSSKVDLVTASNTVRRRVEVLQQAASLVRLLRLALGLRDEVETAERLLGLAEALVTPGQAEFHP